MTKNPFHSPKAPKNSLELLKWLIFEPFLFKAFEDSLSKKEAAKWFLKMFPWIAILFLFFYFIISLIVLCFDLPVLFPDLFANRIVENWGNSMIDNFLLWSGGYIYLAVGLAIGLAFGLTFGLGFGLAFGLTGALAFGLIYDLAFDLAFGLAFGLTFSSVVTLKYSLTGALAFGFGFGLTFGLTIGLANGLASGASFFIAWNLFYFRLIFFPFHFLKSFFSVSLKNNSYISDAVIWLPIPGLKKKLLSQTWDDPGLGIEFAYFLLEFRPLQQRLSYQIIHTAKAAEWFHNPLNPKKLVLPEIGEQNKKSNYSIPSKKWIDIVKKVTDDLRRAKKNNNPGLKKEGWDVFHNHLKELERATLLENAIWRDAYLKSIRLWIKESDKKLTALSHELQRTQPITRNVYRHGEPLGPGEPGEHTFVGREDLREELNFQLHSSEIMPTILLQGQRRVGKTSLLNFLQELLGSGFLIVKMDIQRGDCKTISKCLKSFITEAKCLLDLEISEEPDSDDPLEAWETFEAFFRELAEKESRKIILAFDEYEAFHTLLCNENENGDRFLGAMRSFSQRQNNVVFLFTGLYIFPDLGEPDFSRYFVHAKRLRVDYLDEASSKKLITQPCENFNIIYPPELVEDIYRITSGHPALLQQICSEIVDLANRKVKNRIDKTDLDAAMDEVLDRSNAVMINFWVHFCDAAMKETVYEIMDGREIKSKKNLARLLDYGFVEEFIEGFIEGLVEKQPPDNGWKLRAPFFEEWIKRHGDSY